MKLLIAEKRAEKNMSKLQLAKKAGVSRSYISELEKGKYKNPGIRIMCSISKALNCKIDDLVEC